MTGTTKCAFRPTGLPTFPLEMKNKMKAKCVMKIQHNQNSITKKCFLKDKNVNSDRKKSSGQSEIKNKNTQKNESNNEK